jgi:hypothetical protein
VGWIKGGQDAFEGAVGGDGGRLDEAGGLGGRDVGVAVREVTRGVDDGGRGGRREEAGARRGGGHQEQEDDAAGRHGGGDVRARRDRAKTQERKVVVSRRRARYEALVGFWEKGVSSLLV